MASLTKKVGSRYWIACFTDSSGKQRQRSTKTTNRTKALKMAHEWEDAYSRQLTEAQARKVMSDIFEEIHGERLLSSSVATYCIQWVKRKEIETRDRTGERYRGVVKSFLEYLGDKAERDIAFLTQRHFAAYRDHVAEKLSITSANNQLKVLRIVMQDGLRDGLLLTNPAALVKTLRKKHDGDERRAFTIEEIRKILAVATDEWRGMILAGLYTGQRLGDISKLTWANVDLAEQEVAFRTGKTGRRVVLPMATPLQTHLLNLSAADSPTAPVFPQAFEIVSKQGKVSTLSRQFSELLADAGLAQKQSHAAKKDGGGRATKRRSGGLSFHCLRHTATSLLKNAGVSDVVARDIIGHDTEAISRVYTHIETKTKKEALDRLPHL